MLASGHGGVFERTKPFEEGDVCGEGHLSADDGGRMLREEFELFRPSGEALGVLSVIVPVAMWMDFIVTRMPLAMAMFGVVMAGMAVVSVFQFFVLVLRVVGFAAFAGTEGEANQKENGTIGFPHKNSPEAARRRASARLATPSKSRRLSATSI